MSSAERSPAVVAEIERLARRRDADAIAQQVLGLDEARRRAIAKELVPFARELQRTWNRTMQDGPLDKLVVLGPALLGTATLSELKRIGWPALPDEVEPAFTVLADRRPEWLAGWADWALDARPWLFPLVRRLVREGVLERPAFDSYALAFIAGHHGPWGGDPTPLHTHLLADPGLLDDELWRIFEVEGGGEISLAAVDKYVPGDDAGWTATLKRLADEGHVPRDRLLDESLATLARDFSSFRAGWFSRFHEALEPTVDERAARADSYTRLLSSPIANTVSFALAALAALDKAGRLDPGEELIERLRPALASERKTTVKKALALVRSAVKAEPALAEAAANAACEAVAHEAAEIQAKALDVIEPCAAAPAVRARLLGLADGVAPTLRDRVNALVGVELPEAGADVPSRATLRELAEALPERERALAGVDEALDADRPPPALRFAVADIPVLAAAQPVEPVRDLDELIDVVGRIVEDYEIEAIEVERAVDGIARLCAERPPDFDARTSSLRKRAAKVLEGRTLAPLVAAWLEGTTPAATARGPRRERSRSPRQALMDVFLEPMEGIGLTEAPLHRRALELAPRVAQRVALPLLAMPTHHDGWIDPRVLVARLRANPEPGREDLLQALLRLAPDGRAEALAAAEPLSGEAADVVRAALGGGGRVRDAMLGEATRLAAGLDRAAPQYRWGFGRRWSADVLAIEVTPKPSKKQREAIRALALGVEDDWAPDGPRLVLLWPAGHQALWAHAIVPLGDGIHPYSSAQDTRLLDPALDPDRPLGELGALAVLLGLSSQSAEVRASAVDATLNAIGDGRLDGVSLGAPFPRLAQLEDFTQPARLAGSLRTVARETTLHAETVRVALEHMVALDRAPRGIHALLDLLNELCADAGAAVTLPAARAFLETFSGSSKAAKLAKALLQREGASRLADEAARIAAAARVGRARGWAGATRR